MTKWPHQLAGVQDVLAAIAGGTRRIVLTSPTGGGKSVMMTDLAENYLHRMQRVVLYSNRKLLVDQLSKVWNAAGLDHGIRSASHEEELGQRMQIASLQTEHSRSMKRKKRALHRAALVLVDEGHLHTGPTAQAILAEHYEQGAAIVYVTATPLDMGDVAEKLIVAGTNSELRKCGALVPALHYGPDEPDLKGFKKQLGEELTEKENKKLMMTPTIFARVIEWYRKLNPEQRPTILFAPGVDSSLWFAEQFVKAGISAAHIDGENVWMDGHAYRSDALARQDLLGRSKDGSIRVLCNRFVLREGVDAPWLSHGILATVFGAMQSYLQSGGRLLRSFPGLASVTIQDHGGNWWRHGSLNADRVWNLAHEGSVVSGLRELELREKKQPEPFLCPRCSIVAIWQKPQCPRCGFLLPPKYVKRRAVIQLDGTLKHMAGDIFRPRPICQKANGPAIWERMYWRCRTEKGRTSFRGAAARFAYENNWQWPNPKWPFMPTVRDDWFRLVETVPMETLTQKVEVAQHA